MIHVFRWHISEIDQKPEVISSYLFSCTEEEFKRLIFERCGEKESIYGKLYLSLDKKDYIYGLIGTIQ